MKNQIFSSILTASVLLTNSVFAMNDELAENHTITKFSKFKRVEQEASNNLQSIVTTPICNVNDPMHPIRYDVMRIRSFWSDGRINITEKSINPKWSTTEATTFENSDFEENK